LETPILHETFFTSKNTCKLSLSNIIFS
jgi:hypothetical protein